MKFLAIELIAYHSAIEDQKYEDLIPSITSSQSLDEDFTQDVDDEISD